MNVNDMIRELNTIQQLGYGDKEVYVSDSEFGNAEIIEVYLTSDNLVMIDHALL